MVFAKVASLSFVRTSPIGASDRFFSPFNAGCSNRARVSLGFLGVCVCIAAEELTSARFACSVSIRRPVENS
jgi:hypothetical protein